MVRIKKDEPSTMRTRRPHYGWSRYWEATQEPLYSLLFLLPLVVVYEFLAMMLRPTPDSESPLVAHALLHTLFSWVGARSVWLPGLALVITLFVWHILSRHRWQIHLIYLPLMLVESILLTIPLFVIARLVLAGTTAPSDGLPDQVVLALGAGIFEELLFRLYLITLLLLLFRDALRIPRGVATGLAIGLSALAFAACHFEPVGEFAWNMTAFVPYLIDGVYLALVFVGRGLGVATGCHVAYNLLLVLRNHAV